jgi:hypothetical protein
MAPIGRDETTVAEGAVSGCDRRRAHPQPGRERADRGQALARPELARRDQPLDLAGDGCRARTGADILY